MAEKCAKAGHTPGFCALRPLKKPYCFVAFQLLAFLFMVERTFYYVHIVCVHQFFVHLVAYAFPGMTAPPDAGLDVVVNDKTAFFTFPLRIRGKQLHLVAAGRAFFDF